MALDLHRPGARAARRTPASSRARGRDEDAARLPARRARLPQPHAGRAAATATSPSRVLRNFAGRHLAEAAVAAAARLERRRAGGDRRQGGEGSALPPAACRRLGRAPGRRHRRIAPPHAGRAGTRCGRYIAELFDDDAVDAAAAASGLGPRCERAARALAGRGARRCSTRPRSRCPPTRAFRSTRQARRAQRAHGLPAGRDAVPAARLSRRRVVSAAAAADAASTRAWARARQRARPRGAGAVGARPRHRARGAVDGDDGLRGRAHADLLRLPGHRGDRAQRPRRARRRRPGPGARDACAARRPGPPTGSATTAGASCATTASRRRGPVRPRQARRSASLRRARRAVACPRCGSAHTERLSAFGSTACKALYRCLACREPFEYFKPI